MDLRTAIQALLERFWLVTLCVVVGAALTVAYLHRAPRIYVATATLQADQQEHRVVKFERVQQEDLRFTDMLQTIVQIISSRPVLERVVQEEELVKVFTSTSGVEPTADEAAATLKKTLEVRLRRGTRLIDIVVSTTDPQLSKRLANALARQYLKFSSEHQSASSQAASEFLVEEAQRLKRRLQNSESKLQAYKEEVKSISLEDRHDIVTARLRELSQEVNQAKTARARLEVEFLQVRTLESNVPALLVLPRIANDPAINSVMMNLATLENEFSNLQERYMEKHPKYIQALGRIQHWGATLTNSVLSIAKTIHAAYENAVKTEAAMENALVEQEHMALELSKLGVQYNVLQREIESDRALYDSVLTRLKETSLTKDLHSNKVRILEPAKAPRSPTFPNTQKVLMLGITGSLAFGAALVLFLRSLDTSIKTVDQLEEYLRVPALTVVERIGQLRDPRKQLVMQERAQSAGAEAFRSLRTSVSMLGHHDSRRILLFTSALPSEGKTFCAANYALCLAQAGLRTVLIDADLRRPAVERLFCQTTGQRGATDYLAGQASLQEILLPTQHRHLLFVAAGTSAPNPSELLSQGGISKLFQEVLRDCDRVVVDSSPVHPVSDTLLLVPHVHTVLFVVRAGRTPWKVCARAIETMHKAGAAVSGIVLNAVKVPKLGGAAYGVCYGYPDKL